ncbi:MAG: hypothetical protein FJW35_03660 [Acidobacteria bacterium]|nr:hypothetical protein [Acidobacteriota bacterium]
MAVFFSTAERRLVGPAMEEAEERTSRYYCFPPHRWQNLRYDLLTREDRDWMPIPEQALARIQRLRMEAQPRRPSLEFFRIQLNDPAILDVAGREALRADLYPLLVFILTHEMVHLVRLSSILCSEENRPVCREEEESRVDRIARQILAQIPHHRLQPIIEKFGGQSP